MLFGNVFGSEFCNVRILLAPDDPGSGGGGEPDATPPDDKKFSQTELDALIEKRLAREKKEHLKALKEQQDQVAAVAQQLKDLEAKHNPSPTDPAGATTAGQIELLTQKHARELVGLQTQLDEFKKTAENERQLRMSTERDKLIQEALSAAQCRDIVGGYRYFIPQVTYDEVDKQWVMTTKNGNTVTVVEGVAAEMPDYLKPASMQNGGSGSTGGGPLRKSERHRLLEEAKRDLDNQMKIAKSNPSDSAQVAMVSKFKRKVKDLEAELAKMK